MKLLGSKIYITYFANVLSLIVIDIQPSDLFILKNDRSNYRYCDTKRQTDKLTDELINKYISSTVVL